MGRRLLALRKCLTAYYGIPYAPVSQQDGPTWIPQQRNDRKWYPQEVDEGINGVLFLFASEARCRRFIRAVGHETLAVALFEECNP